MTLKIDIEKAVENALGAPGSIHVIKASPGQGKTHGTIQVLADLIKAGKVSRVLWAVRETLKADSLGAEAAGKLTDAGLNANVIYGKPRIQRFVHHVTGSWGVKSKELAKARHAAQFEWGSHPEVKVISHTHLGLIYGKDGRSKAGRALQPLKEAELLIIDEDPTDVFLISDDIINKRESTTSSRKRLRLNREFFQGRKDVISQTIFGLLERAVRGDFDSDAKRWKKQYSLTGKPFWDALSAALPAGASWKEFAESIGKTAMFNQSSNIQPWVVSRMRQALRDHQRGVSSSAQFGLSWPAHRDGKAAVDVKFRFDVSQYRPIACSVVILDAYAHVDHYTAVFNPSPVRVYDLTDGSVLHIKKAVGMGRSRERVLTDTPSAREHLLTIMEQAVKYAGQHGSTLLLCYKTTKAEYNRALQRACELHPLPPGVEVELQHWRSGRGSNKWEGWNVVALEEFVFPREYAEHSLAAIVPGDSAADRLKRKELWLLHSESERLQMLFRGRQTLAAARGWSRTPEVIAFFEPRFEMFSGAVATSKTDEFMPQAKRTTRPRFAQAVGDVTLELEALLGGVPLVLFQVIGLERRKESIKQSTEDHLREKLKDLVGRSTLPLPLLREWLTSGQLPGYEETGRSGRNGRDEFVTAAQQVNSALLECRGLYPHVAPRGVKRTQQTVLAVSEHAAQEALNSLFDKL